MQAEPKQRFDSEVQFRVPGGFVEALNAAAISNVMNFSEYCRQAVRSRLVRDGYDPVTGDTRPDLPQ